MAPPATKKSDSTAPEVPAWHPNLRIAANLPDTKVVRTAFFVNGATMLVAIALLLVLGHQEWSLHEVHKQIADLQRDIDRDSKSSAAAVALYGNFKGEEAKTLEVANFITSKPILSEIILRLGQITPKKIAFDALDFRSTGLTIRATVKGAPDRASGDASAYEKQLRADKVLGPMFSDVNLLTMKRNAITGRLVIDILCEFSKGAKKK
jgi:hypothetical protein